MSGVLPVFPGAGFESSLLTAVLVGVLVTAALHETLGWGFVGLVVPGYLASIFLVRPSSGVVVVVEAVTTYALVWIYARWLAPRFNLGPLFGRDRFFALLIVSVLVRVVSEGWALPRLAVHTAALGLPIDDGTGLYAVGLVVVPLAANVLWTPGLRRGAVQLVVTTAVTFAALRLLLVPHTNLAISDFELSFEDIAASFAASPKAYIILISAALLATIAVRRYGWSVGGTLVPGLLAIAWLTPSKAIATLVEVGVVLAIAQPLRARGWLRGANVSRRLLAAFLLLYGAKILFALVADTAQPGLRATDLFGMGYVLPALLVERVWATGSLARVIAPSVVLSLVGAIVGVGVSHSLDRFTPVSLAPPDLGVERVGDWDAHGEMARARARVAVELPSVAAPKLSPADLAAFRATLRAAAKKRWQVAARIATVAGGQLTRLDGAVSIHERLDDPALARGLGTFILFVPERPGPVLELPFPHEEPVAAMAALQLARVMGARAILVGGTARRSRRDNPLSDTGPLAVGRQILASSHHPVVRLRQGARTRVVGPTSTLPWLTPLGPELGLDLEQLYVADATSDRHLTVVLPEREWRRVASVDLPLPERLPFVEVEKRLAAVTTSGRTPPPVATRMFVETALRPAVEHGCYDDGLRYAAAAARAAGAALAPTTIPPDREAVLVDGGWITVLLGLCASTTDLIVEIPRARSETGTLELGVDLLVALRGRSLVATGSAPGDALLRARNTLRRPPTAVPVVNPDTVRLLVRGFAERRDLEEDVAVAAGAAPIGSGSDAAMLTRDRLVALGLDARLATDDRSHAFAWSTGGLTPLLRHPRTVVIWASAEVRRQAREARRTRRTHQAAQLLPTVIDLPAWLSKRRPTTKVLDRERVVDLGLDYVARSDPGSLRALERLARAAGAHPALWLPEGGGAHVAVATRRGARVQVVAFALAPRVGAPFIRGDDLSLVERYAAAGGRQLIVDTGGEP